ncbi:hypothetical protein SKAU_G00063910 [Synaphobranchus kaupii]|uniref:Uncharacterized protein n=1 Tax=Synaphobranchus kaupii TaxID=118154 RepID=A0A9Q1J9V9_SYNKA|nr:hypothetical protein SKAU_G00063910 [Synaphobranchus kaupii]
MLSEGCRIHLYSTSDPGFWRVAPLGQFDWCCEGLQVSPAVAGETCPHIPCARVAGESKVWATDGAFQKGDAVPVKEDAPGKAECGESCSLKGQVPREWSPERFRDPALAWQEPQIYRKPKVDP